MMSISPHPAHNTIRGRRFMMEKLILKAQFNNNLKISDVYANDHTHAPTSASKHIISAQIFAPIMSFQVYKFLQLCTVAVHAGTLLVMYKNQCAVHLLARTTQILLAYTGVRLHPPAFLHTLTLRRDQCTLLRCF